VLTHSSHEPHKSHLIPQLYACPHAPKFANRSHFAFCIVFSRVACYNSRFQELSARIGYSAIRIQNYEIS
jgi:hypothetical protein